MGGQGAGPRCHPVWRCGAGSLAAAGPTCGDPAGGPDWGGPTGGGPEHRGSGEWRQGGKGRGGEGRSGEVRGGMGRPLEWGPGKIGGAGDEVVVVLPPRVWREGEKPGNKEGKGDGGAKGEGQTLSGGVEPEHPISFSSVLKPRGVLCSGEEVGAG